MRKHNTKCLNNKNHKNFAKYSQNCPYIYFISDQAGLVLERAYLLFT
jgi:hypothetical protein